MRYLMICNIASIRTPPAGGAPATTRLVTAFLYGLNPSDFGTFATSAAILFAISLLDGFLPARRAAMLDPMSALRDQ